MTRKTKLWAASVFTAINIAGAGYAATIGEGMHALVHVVLLFLGGYYISRLGRRPPALATVSAPETDRILDHIQHSLDAMAIEVERVGEAQRFMAKLAERETLGPKPPA